MAENNRLDARISDAIPVAERAKKITSALATPSTPRNAFRGLWFAPCVATVIAAGPGTRISITVVTRKIE